MTKVPLLTAVMLVTITGTGLASREWRPAPEMPRAIDPHDRHLHYYEEIRPLLTAPMASMLCSGHVPDER